MRRCLLLFIAGVLVFVGCDNRAKPFDLAMPGQVSPASGSVFSAYPRVTVLKWSSVPGARSYSVEVDYLHCGGQGKWCSEAGDTARPGRVQPSTYVSRGIAGTEHTFNFVGAQPGRWRVWAVGADGSEGPKTGWWEFRYTR